MPRRTTAVPARLLKVPVVAERLGVSERTVWRLIEVRELSVHRIGKSVRIGEDDLRRYLERVRED